jgi:hypothetical protein
MYLYAMNIRIFDHFLEKLRESVNNWHVRRVNNEMASAFERQTPPGPGVMPKADRREGEEPRAVDSILYTASVAVSDSAPATSFWHTFANGAAFGGGVIATFAVFCGALLAGDAVRRRAAARARLRRALADLDNEDIVALIQRQAGDAG